LVTSCTAYNECRETVGDVVGYTAIELELRESSVRYREMPVGNLVADSFYEVAADNCGGDVPCPDLAVENAGAIRSFTEGGCDRRESIAPGPILSTDIESILPFAHNHLVQAELTGRDLKLVLEHAVDRLREVNSSDTSGWFMQVSHLRFSVDCEGEKYVLSGDGRQVLSRGNRVRSAEVRRDTPSGPVWEPVNLDDNRRVFHVVTNDFIGSARDGHLGFAVRDGSDRVVLDGEAVRLRPQRDLTDRGQNFNDAHAVKRYIRARNDRGQDVAPLVDGRINLSGNCFQRVRQ
jgi:hypothetical protein